MFEQSQELIGIKIKFVLARKNISLSIYKELITMSQTSKNIIVGIDVGSEKLDVAYGYTGKVRTIDNTKASCKKLSKELKKQNVSLVVLEATGSYHTKMLEQLWEQGVKVSVVNPRQTNAFMKSLGTQAKTDKIDAKGLSLFGERMKPRETEPKSQSLIKLEQLGTRRQQLVDNQTAEKNRLKQFNDVPEVKKSIETTLKYLKKQIESIEVIMGDLISSDEELKKKSKIIKSNKGAGQVLVFILLASMPELGRVNKKAIASLTGLAPFPKESGKYKGKRAIKGGRKKVRNVLYMCARSAVQHDKSFGDYYSALIKRGKLDKVAITATMRKFIVMLNAQMREFYIKNEALAT